MNQTRGFSDSSFILHPSSLIVMPSPAADALRVVLFGLPDAGKSALLGALGQAAATQEIALQGQLDDESHGLDELRKSVYEQHPRVAVQEVEPYPVRYQPYPGAGLGDGRMEAVLYDCDGRAATDLLSGKQALAPGGAALAQAVLAADALVLIVDASQAGQRDADLAAFDQFLETFER